MEKRNKKKKDNIGSMEYKFSVAVKIISRVDSTPAKKNKKTGVALLHKLLAALILLVIRSSCLASTEYIYIYVSLKTTFL